MTFVFARLKNRPKRILARLPEMRAARALYVFQTSKRPIVTGLSGHLNNTAAAPENCGRTFGAGMVFGGVQAPKRLTRRRRWVAGRGLPAARRITRRIARVPAERSPGGIRPASPFALSASEAWLENSAEWSAQWAAKRRSGASSPRPGSAACSILRHASFCGPCRLSLEFMKPTMPARNARRSSQPARVAGA